jgi:hypothetical protein
MQLDDDNLRNAFLNAPWVKAVIPIRPGRETAALNWLRAIEGHEDDGWDTPDLGAGPEDAEFAGKTIGEVLTIIAERMSATADVSVFENGFDPLAGGFDAGLPANQVFSQWIGQTHENCSSEAALRRAVRLCGPIFDLAHKRRGAGGQCY